MLVVSHTVTAHVTARQAKRLPGVAPPSHLPRALFQILQQLANCHAPDSIYNTKLSDLRLQWTQPGLSRVRSYQGRALYSTI
jgi:hypothetical protein